MKKLGLFFVFLSLLMLAYFAPNIQQASAAQFADHVVVIAMENMDYSTVLGTGTQSNCQSINATRFLCSMLPYSSKIPHYHSYGAGDFTGDSISGCSAACYVA